MDLAVVYPRLDRLGGAEKFGLKLMGVWGREHDLTVYTLAADEGLLREFGVKAKVVVCKTEVPGWRENTLALMTAVKGMARQIGRHDRYILNMFPTHTVDVHPNVWIAHEPARMLYDCLPELASDKSIPLRVRLMMRLYFPLLRIPDRMLYAADKMVANSKYSGEYLKQVYGKDAKVIYPGVDVADEPAFGGEYVLAVGRLVRLKRIELAVRAMEHLPDMKLKVAGAGPDGLRLRSIAGPNVEFLGNVTEAQMQGLYRDALCTVFTPLREPFGMVALESIASGTPVIGGLEGGYTEVLEDGLDCILTDPTPENIASKIKHLRDNPDAAKRMGTAGYETAKEHSWEKCAKEILDYALS